MKSTEQVGTDSIRVQEMGADLRCECPSFFSAGAQISLHRQVKQLFKTHKSTNMKPRGHMWLKKDKKKGFYADFLIISSILLQN